MRGNWKKCFGKCNVPLQCKWELKTWKRGERRISEDAVLRRERKKKWKGKCEGWGDRESAGGVEEYERGRRRWHVAEGERVV